MPRPSSVWKRKGRDGWWTTIGGRQVCLGDDHAQAERELHRLKGSAVPLPPTRATVAGLVDQYLEWVEPRVKPGTYDRYRGYLQSWVTGAGQVAVAGLTVDHVYRWLGANAWGQSSQWLALSILRLWAAWCDDRGYSVSVVVRKAKKPKMRRRDAPAPGALEATIGAVVMPDFADFAAVLLDVGCRPGELASLEAAGIDWERATAWVSGKTGRRLVGLTVAALAILRRHATRHPTGAVFRNSRGEPWTSKAIGAQFRRSRVRAGVGGVVAYHTRHAFWGRAHKAGLSDIVVAKQMGHSDLSMLAKHYADVEPEMLRDAAEKASQKPP